MEDLMKILGVIAFVVLVIFIEPLLMFWLCYFGGWIAKIVIGTKLCLALNTLFNTTYFVPTMLPWMAGALGWIGGYFKSSSLRTEQDK